MYKCVLKYLEPEPCVIVVASITPDKLSVPVVVWERLDVNHESTAETRACMVLDALCWCFDL